MTDKIYEKNKFLAISSILLIRVELIGLGMKDNSKTAYRKWTNKVKAILYSSLSSDEQEWLDEMILPNELSLESLHGRLVDKVPMLKNTVRWIGVQQLLVHLMLFIFANDTIAVAYDARLRAAFKSLIRALIEGDRAKKPVSVILSLAESEVICKIAEQVEQVADRNAISRKGEESSKNAFSKWAGIGIATVAGGILVGVTGGLAVPFVASSLSALGVAGAGLTAFGSVSGAALVGSAFGVTGAGLAGYKISKHFRDLDEFFFTPLSAVSSGLSYSIVISGWLPELESSNTQWHQLTELNPMLEVMILNYDRQSLVDLANAAMTYLKAGAVSYSVYGAAVAATGSLAVAASLPITALSTVAMLDNPWNLCLTKSEKAGIILARNVLSDYIGGKRPVTLLGHGMGARVIVYCLLELLKLDIDIYGIIDSVYLFGACISLSKSTWETIRSIPASRFVNCYSTNDWFLKLMFQIQLSPTAGISPIEVDGIEDIDVSSLIGSHDEYVIKFDELMGAVGIGKY